MVSITARVQTDATKPKSVSLYCDTNGRWGWYTVKEPIRRGAGMRQSYAKKIQDAFGQALSYPAEKVLAILQSLLASFPHQ